jgi:hypothetical protein
VQVSNYSPVPQHAVIAQPQKCGHALSVKWFLRGLKRPCSFLGMLPIVTIRPLLR